MVLVHLMAALQKARPFRAPVLVVVISALLALLFTIATQSGEPEPPRAAGEAAMHLVTDEHVLVDGFVRSLQAAEKAEQVIFERDRAEMRALALAESAGQPALAGPAWTGRTAQAAALPRRSVIGPPLSLQPTAVVSQPQRKSPVAAQTRAAPALIGRMQRWLRAGVEEAADWAISAPTGIIARLPDRRFL